MRWSFGCCMLTDLYVIPGYWRQKFIFRDCDSLFGRERGHLQSGGAFLRLGTVARMMSILGHSWTIWAHRAQAQQMQSSHDAKGSNQMDMCSLGVVDLDLSISLDAFGLRAFDHKKPLTRMLPGSTPCELRLMLPDSTMGSDGFHDVIMYNLAATPAVCEVWIEPALDVYMINVHLEMAQLWCCPVEWCAVSKGLVRACLEHLSKHGGSSLFALKNVAKFPPPPPLDCSPPYLADCPSAQRFRCCCRRAPLP